MSKKAAGGSKRAARGTAAVLVALFCVVGMIAVFSTTHPFSKLPADQPLELEDVHAEAADLLKFLSHAKTAPKPQLSQTKQSKAQSSSSSSSSSGVVGNIMTNDETELDKELNRDEGLESRDKLRAKSLLKQARHFDDQLQAIKAKRQAEMAILNAKPGVKVTGEERSKLKGIVQQLIHRAQLEMHGNTHAANSKLQQTKTASHALKQSAPAKPRQLHEGVHNAEKVRVAAALRKAKDRLERLQSVDDKLSTARKNVALLQERSEQERKQALKDFGLAGSMLNKADKDSTKLAAPGFGSSSAEHKALLATLKKSGAQHSGQLAEKAVAMLRQSRVDSESAVKAKHLVDNLEAEVSGHNMELQHQKLTVNLLKGRLAQLNGGHGQGAPQHLQGVTVQGLSAVREEALSETGEGLDLLNLAKTLGNVLDGENITREQRKEIENYATRDQEMAKKIHASLSSLENKGRIDKKQMASLDNRVKQEQNAVDAMKLV